MTTGELILLLFLLFFWTIILPFIVFVLPAIHMHRLQNHRIKVKDLVKTVDRVHWLKTYEGVFDSATTEYICNTIDIGENKTSCKLWIQSFDIIALIAYDDNTVSVTILRDDDGLIEIESYDCVANRKNKYLYMPKNYYYYNMLYIIKKINEVYNYYHKIVV